MKRLFKGVPKGKGKDDLVASGNKYFNVPCDAPFN
jgi:hypothetical protein